MKLVDTRDKFEEAQVFLRCLDEAQHDERARIPFRYCLSAFLSAAYGAREYLEAEFIRVQREQVRAHGQKLLKGVPPAKLYVQHHGQWIAKLSKGKLALWNTMIGNRESETHERRVKTVTKPKPVSVKPAPPFPYGTERTFAFAAHYVMYQQVAAYYPDMAWRENQLLLGTDVQAYLEEHHLEVAGVLQATVTACGDYVALLDSLISHFEQSVP